MTELVCPSCGANLKRNDVDPTVAVCEYCQARHILTGRGIPERLNYVSIKEREPDPKQVRREKLHMFLCIGIALMGLILLPIAVFSELSGMNREKESVPELPPLRLKKEWEEVPVLEEVTAEEVRISGVYGELLREVYQMDPEQISEEELLRIKWIALRYGEYTDTYEVGYSFEEPTAEGAELSWLSFPREMSLGGETLTLLKGLKKLDVHSSLQPEHIEGLSLESVGAYFDSPQEVMEVVDNYASLKEISFHSGLESLEGMDQFTNLECLSIDGLDTAYLGWLENLPHLKELTLRGDNLTDFSLFADMDGLVSLSLSAERLKRIDFVGEMDSLEQLEIAGGMLLSLDGLERAQKLKVLRIYDCYELQQMTAVEGLTGLQELSLMRPYDCEEPNLGGLTELTHLELEGFSECGFLKNLVKLQSLSLHSCEVSDLSGLSALTGLKELTCTDGFGMGMGMNLEFIWQLKGLEELNLESISTYQDISPAFGLPALKRLDINQIECELDFDKILPNTVLESLSMDKILLYKNVEIYGEGGFYSIYYDDVILDEETEALARLSGLKELSIRENELTNLNFAAGLHQLETIDFSDNYITTLEPLEKLENLKSVIYAGNPITDADILSEQGTQSTETF